MRAPVEMGEVLGGKYRVERIIGAGGVGVVAAATDLQSGALVAVKLLYEGALPETLERFAREARAASRLKGEHVTRVLDVGERESGAPFMVMEHLEGSDLSALLKQRGALEIADAVDYVLQACEALAEAHRIGIVHRDIKPANLFLAHQPGGAPRIKVVDFGLSKRLAGAPGETMGETITKTTDFVGSPLYMSPEQLRSAYGVDERSDIWSLGVTLYQLVTGQYPFQSTSYTQLILEVAHEPPRRPITLRPDLPEALEAAILRCLEKEREARFASVGELALAIAPFGPAHAQATAERVAKMAAQIPSTPRGPRSVAPPPTSAAPPFAAPAPASLPAPAPAPSRTQARVWALALVCALVATAITFLALRG